MGAMHVKTDRQHENHRSANNDDDIPGPALDLALAFDLLQLPLPLLYICCTFLAMKDSNSLLGLSLYCTASSCTRLIRLSPRTSVGSILTLRKALCLGSIIFLYEVLERHLQILLSNFGMPSPSSHRAHRMVPRPLHLSSTLASSVSSPFQVFRTLGPVL